jgi:hypothetical protein
MTSLMLLLLIRLTLLPWVSSFLRGWIGKVIPGGKLELRRAFSKTPTLKTSNCCYFDRLLPLGN